MFGPWFEPCRLSFEKIHCHCAILYFVQYFVKNEIHQCNFVFRISNTVADPGFAKGEADHGERAVREPKRRSGGGAPSGVLGTAPGRGSGHKAPLKLKAFCTFLYKKVAKS